jgi:tetratricopeptide (TPR) repeat protein
MDTPRIEDLKRRIQRDPASIAFAQLGEEYRRAGRYREAVETCRAGLARHPGYLSARVTLGRALTELGSLEQAVRELQDVLRVAPENRTALRGLADAVHRRGDLALALTYYESALALAPGDADLQQLVRELRGDRAAEPAVPTKPPQAAVAAERLPAPIPAGEDARALLPKFERWLDAIINDRLVRAAAGRGV